MFGCFLVPVHTPLRVVAENEKELSMQLLVGGFGASFPRTYWQGLQNTICN